MKQLTLFARPASAATEVLEIRGLESLDAVESDTLNRFMRTAHPSYNAQSASTVRVPEGTGRLLANSLKLLLEPRGIQLRCCA